MSSPHSAKISPSLKKYECAELFGPSQKPFAKPTFRLKRIYKMSFATRLASLGGTRGLATALALVLCRLAGDGPDAPAQRPRLPHRQPLVLAPPQLRWLPVHPRPRAPQELPAAGPVYRSDGGAGQGRALPARMDEGLRQGPGYQRGNLLHDPRFRVGSGPARSRRRRSTTSRADSSRRSSCAS